MNYVTDRLYIGDAIDAGDAKTYEQITTVINLSWCANRHTDKITTYIDLPIADHPDQNLLTYHFDHLSSIIDFSIKTGAVFVYCMMGMSRSAAIVLAYLMKVKKMTYSDSYSLLKAVRPVICPNPGFVAQLLRYERLCRHTEKQNLS